MLEVKVHDSQGLASQAGSESCGARSNSGDEALTGGCIGRVLSHESGRTECRELPRVSKATLNWTRGRAQNRLRVVEDPEHVHKHTGWEPRDPVVSRRGGW